MRLEAGLPGSSLPHSLPSPFTDPRARPPAPGISMKTANCSPPTIQTQSWGLDQLYKHEVSALHGLPQLMVLQTVSCSLAVSKNMVLCLI